jgi:sugar/nucleoside kinase (ribokinase family)
VKQGVLCAGRVYCDLVFSGLAALPQSGREVFAGDLQFNAGGGAYITAAYLCALGRPASLLTRLPDGPFAQIVLDEVRDNGVDAGAVALVADPTPQITVAMVGAGDRAFLTRRVGAALPGQIAPAFAAAGLGHLHIGEITTLIEHPDLPELARRYGMTVSLDCGWDDDALGREDLGRFISMVDVFLPNADEARAVAGGRLIDAVAPVVVVKDGARGATWYAERRSVHRAARPASVVDATGAGDAFVAGFLHAWLRKLPAEQCLDLGNACGAIAVGRLGGAGQLPPMSDMDGQADSPPATV